MINLKLVTKNTGKYGNGIFAGEDIKKGTKIYTLSGEKMDINDWIREVDIGKENIDDSLQVGKRTYIDLDKISRIFNHSCNPNTGIRKRSDMFALRDIKKGEEITYDYSLTIAPTIWSMKCKCGTENCRQNVKDILSVPKKKLEEYKKVGALQSYMKKLLKEIESGNYKIPAYEIESFKINKKFDNLSLKNSH